MSRLEFIYAFENESMPGLFKIGETHSDTPLKRLGEANLPDTYRPPTFYTLAFAIKVPDSKKAERYIHTLLENTRVNMNREFFRISLDDVTNIINNNMHIINGEWWTPPIDIIIPKQQLTKKAHGLHCFGAASKVFRKKSVKHLNNRFEMFKHLYNNLHDLRILIEDSIDLNKSFTRENIKLLNYNYRTSTVAEINRLCNKQVFQKVSIDKDGKISNFSEKKVVTIMNAQLNNIGYKVKHSSKRIRVGGGKQIHVYSYQIIPNDDDKSHILLNRKIFKNFIL